MLVDEGLKELQGSLIGSVIGHTDAEYDSARRCFNALVDRRPAVIVRCLGTADVATAFEFARTNELEVAVRGGGHNPAGHCVLDGGLVIDLSLMRTVDVDRDAGIARAQGGATWLDFDAASQSSGLVTPGGVVGSTGVAPNKNATPASIRPAMMSCATARSAGTSLILVVSKFCILATTRH